MASDWSLCRVKDLIFALLHLYILNAEGVRTYVRTFIRP